MLSTAWVEITTSLEFAQPCAIPLVRDGKVIFILKTTVRNNIAELFIPHMAESIFVFIFIIGAIVRNPYVCCQ